MKTFREHVSEKAETKKVEKVETKIDAKGFEKCSAEAIKHINMMIEFGRKSEMDNKALNPLLDAIKNIHAGEDSIRKATEVKEEPEPEEAKKEEPKKDDKTW